MPDTPPASQPVPAEGPIRLFFALWPDAATVRALGDWAERARAVCGGRIMRPDTLHLTLGFLGDTAPHLLPALAKETAARRIEPGTVILSRYGAFPRPRIVWAGPADDGEGQPDEGTARLAAEHRGLWDWVRGLHPARPEARFRPHVTLLRNADTRVLPEQVPPAIAWRYDRYVLVASMQDGSARYRIVASTQA
ncbi:RNA 2',3'-cyclic phosphodiesterase [Bordetella bronchialis]|uniref:RNA 2',3'-cyclic phosphodiesterase n=1 Tax=Bordetella bronchialis TaxID=463025 RepID=A0ABM6CMQ6_9BORD|nr:RNA 2',3'-cyclic phosphodiesterase [Bordetella bronchialis]ANN65218.1 2'-5' RNA ligase [Bordetella bronchialis]